MDKQQQQPPQQPPPKDPIETEVRKARRGKKKVSFNLKIEERDVQIMFH